MEKKVRIGIAGMGNMGCKYAEMILQGQAPGLKLTAVARISQSRIKWAQEMLPGSVRVFPDAAELLDYDNLDAVLIASPHDAHEQQAVAALRKGLHVLCEKPAGVYALQARRMAKEAEMQNRVLALMFQRRLDPVFQKIKEIVDSKKYGAIKRVNWIVTDWYRPDVYYRMAAWRCTWAQGGGGLLLNQCAHNLDLLQWICGMPVRVWACCSEGKYHDIEVEDDATAYLEFANGATGVFLTSTGEGAGTNRLEIALNNARLLLVDHKLYLFELEEEEKVYRKFSQDPFGKIKGSWHIIEIPGEDHAYAGVLQNFAEAVLEHKPLIASGAEGIKSLTLTNAMYLSSWKKQMIELPMDEQEFLAELKKRSGAD